MSICRIVHDSANPEGANSAYVLRDRGVVIDPGPPGERAWQTLREELTKICDFREINHILLTHWHIDHVGLAPRLAEATNASIHLQEDDAPLVGDYAHERRQRLIRDERKLEQWGVPTERVTAVISRDEPSPLPPSHPVQAHSHNDIIAGIRLVHTPGHTLGHAGFHTGSEFFAGDAVLETYTPNVGGSDTRVENALTTYRKTLQRLLECDTDLSSYPGHGAALNYGARIEAILDHHNCRSANVLTVLEKRDSATPWEVATTLFGEMRGIHVKMGAGEAAAHLDYLASKGRAVRVESDPLRFSR